MLSGCKIDAFNAQLFRQSAVIFKAHIDFVPPAELCGGIQPVIGFLVKTVLQPVHFPERLKVLILYDTIVIVAVEGCLPEFLFESFHHQPGNVEVQLFMRQGVAVPGFGPYPGSAFYKNTWRRNVIRSVSFTRWLLPS